MQRILHKRSIRVLLVCMCVVLIFVDCLVLSCWSQLVMAMNDNKECSLFPSPMLLVCPPVLNSANTHGSYSFSPGATFQHHHIPQCRPFGGCWTEVGIPTHHRSLGAAGYARWGIQSKSVGFQCLFQPPCQPIPDQQRCCCHLSLLRHLHPICLCLQLHCVLQLLGYYCCYPLLWEVLGLAASGHCVPRMVLFDFEWPPGKKRQNGLDSLHEVLADQESTFAEVRTGADPVQRIWSVFRVEQFGDWHVCALHQVMFEWFSPWGKFTITSNVI